MREADWADDDAPADWLVLSEDENHDGCAVLEQSTGRYLELDRRSNDRSLLGATTAAFLDAIWEDWGMGLSDDESIKSAPVLKLIIALAEVLPAQGWRVIDPCWGDCESAGVCKAAEPETFVFFSTRKQPAGTFRVECERAGAEQPVLVRDAVAMSEAVDLLKTHLL